MKGIIRWVTSDKIEKLLSDLLMIKDNFKIETVLNKLFEEGGRGMFHALVKFKDHKRESSNSIYLTYILQ